MKGKTKYMQTGVLCAGCGEQFFTRADFDMRVKHPPGKPLYCEGCADQKLITLRTELEWVKAERDELEEKVERVFPILISRKKVAWAVAELAYKGYAIRFPQCAMDQSLERIAERGGFGLEEIVEYITAALKGE
jgi:hypothetical protein